MSFKKRLKPRPLEILKLLSQRNYASQIANRLEIARSTVSYWTKKFENQGLIICVKRYPFKEYILTEACSKTLTRSEGGSLCRVEDYPIKYGVVEWEKVPIDWVKLGDPRNWVKMGFRLNGVRVVKTSKSVIIHSGQISGSNPFELAYDAGRICDRVSGMLEDKFGMVLRRGKPLRKAMIHYYDPIFDELAKRAAVTVDGIGSIDASPPSLRGHIEYPIDLAKEIIESPVHLRRLDDNIKGIRKDMMCLFQGQANQTQQNRTLIDSVILMTASVRELVVELREQRKKNQIFNLAKG